MMIIIIIMSTEQANGMSCVCLESRVGWDTQLPSTEVTHDALNTPKAQRPEMARWQRKNESGGSGVLWKERKKERKKGREEGRKRKKEEERSGKTKENGREGRATTIATTPTTTTATTTT